ncbi:hypothetical protein AVEN_225573-1, partial [Araneus ventricosus]
ALKKAFLHSYFTEEFCASLERSPEETLVDDTQDNKYSRIFMTILLASVVLVLVMMFIFLK